GLGGLHALRGEQLDEVGLAGDGVVGEELGDAVLPLRLGQRHQASSSRKRSTPRKAWSRLWACGITTLWGPSTTEAATSSPRWAGRQCMKRASGAAAAITSSSTRKPSKAWRRASASSSWPIDAHTSVCTASAPSAAS